VAEKDISLRVPHPYFYYKKGAIQCYGMELINGINLEQGIAGEYGSDMEEALQASLRNVDRDVLNDEIEQFFDAMHTVCLHGDIKPANIMVSREGKFYVIDFGQSVLTNDISEKDRDAFEVKKQDEKDGTRAAIRFFLSALFGRERKAA
jgi:RIO-like serine/threonine protein kinase